MYMYLTSLQYVLGFGGGGKMILFLIKAWIHYDVHNYRVCFTVHALLTTTFTRYNRCIHSLLLYSALKTLNSKGGIFTGFGVHVFCGVAHSGYHHVYGHVLLLYILLHQRSWEWLWRYRRTNHWGKERRHSIETF